MSLGEEGSSPSTGRLMPKTCESVVTNEREVVRLIKMVRPKWKRADLILQVCFWVFGVLNSLLYFSFLTFLLFSGFPHFAQIKDGLPMTSTMPRQNCWYKHFQGDNWTTIALVIALFDTALFKKMNILFEWIIWILKKWIFCLNEYSGF